MQIEISAKCNLNCAKCHRRYSDRETGFMSLDIFKEIVDKLKQSEILKPFLYIAGYGESMLNPSFWDMVKYAKRNDCNLMLPTNGTLLTKEVIPKLRMIDSLQLSIDSFALNKTLRDDSDGILKWLPELRRYRVPTQLNVVIEKRNYNEYYKFLHYSVRNQVPVYFMFSTPLKRGNKPLEDELKFCISKFNEMNHMKSQFYALNSNSLDVQIDSTCKSFKKCRFLHNDFAIAWNGDLAPCCDAMLLDHKFGHLSNYNTLDDFFNSEIMQQIRRGNHSVCDYCKYWDAYFEQNYKPKPIYDKRLDKFHNLHKNKRCFVLGNGTSLTEDVINLIGKEITIGANQISKAKELWGFEPTYRAISDCRTITYEAYRNELEKLSCPTFYSNIIFVQAVSEEPNDKQFTPKLYNYLKKYIGINILNGDLQYPHLMMQNKESISLDLRRGTTASGTVIQVVSIPLAAYLGCSEIYLIGCDCDNQGNFYDKKKVAISPAGPDIVKQYSWFSERLNQENKKLFNLSFSKLHNVPNVDIDTLFDSKKW